MSSDFHELVYDGDCGFCRYCVAHARAMTGGRVRFTPYQDLSATFRLCHPLDYEGAIHLFQQEHLVASGAGAAFKIRDLAGKGFWWRCYLRWGGFAWVSEAVYRWVSRHRGFCYGLARRVWREPG